MSLALNQTAGFLVTQGTVLSLNKQFNFVNNNLPNFEYNTYVIAPTVTQVINLGLVTGGLNLYIENDNPISVTITNGIVGTYTIVVNGFLMINTPFTAISITNPSVTLSATVTIIVTGA